MSLKSFSSYRNTISALAQLILSVSALAIVYISYGKNDTQENQILIPIFILFAATFLTDKLGGAFTGYSFDKDHMDTKRVFEEIPSMLVSSHDVVTFPGRHQSHAYVKYIIPSAIHVKNTVFRYGGKKSFLGSDAAYNDVLNAKKASLENDCVWTEIISDHLDNSDPVIKLVEEMQDHTRYNVVYIDDKTMPLIQIFIFEFPNREKEVIFGWEFPGIEQGAAFSTRNRRIVDFFDRYFEYSMKFAHPTRMQSNMLSANVRLVASAGQSSNVMHGDTSGANGA